MNVYNVCNTNANAVDTKVVKTVLGAAGSTWTQSFVETTGACTTGGLIVGTSAAYVLTGSDSAKIENYGTASDATSYTSYVSTFPVAGKDCVGTDSANAACTTV